MRRRPGFFVYVAEGLFSEVYTNLLEVRNYRQNMGSQMYLEIHAPVTDQWYLVSFAFNNINSDRKVKVLLISVKDIV